MLISQMISHVVSMLADIAAACTVVFISNFLSMELAIMPLVRTLLSQKHLHPVGQRSWKNNYFTSIGNILGYSGNIDMITYGHVPYECDTILWLVKDVCIHNSTRSRLQSS